MVFESIISRLRLDYCIKFFLSLFLLIFISRAEQSYIGSAHCSHLIPVHKYYFFL
ncbi:unnamed protein product [Acanthoscelides obtectus]|uniref:Uncharacterized protein n=1 Tax=Acanthoscelides obtectus TaxID=200917 RepID=A0A9P0KUK5_ACAOB|nr:unnamed protein product [Acanthoscelides obtectus]CAK1642660.1 hypothetical protein AOBTE_LOCUS13154 [Acanthoscelides obtectus]